MSNKPLLPFFFWDFVVRALLFLKSLKPKGCGLDLAQQTLKATLRRSEVGPLPPSARCQANPNQPLWTPLPHPPPTRPLPCVTIPASAAVSTLQISPMMGMTGCEPSSAPAWEGHQATEARNAPRLPLASPGLRHRLRSCRVPCRTDDCRARQLAGLWPWLCSGSRRDAPTGPAADP